MNVHQEKNGWRVDKSLSLGDLLSVVTAVVLVSLAYGSLSAADNVHDTEIRQIREQRVEDMQRSDARYREILESLQRIEAKFDRKVDK